VFLHLLHRHLYWLYLIQQYHHCLHLHRHHQNQLRLLYQFDMHRHRHRQILQLMNQLLNLLLQHHHYHQLCLNRYFQLHLRHHHLRHHKMEHQQE
jgi:hypothetical protein